MNTIELLSLEGRKDNGKLLLYSITVELITQSETEPLDSCGLHLLFLDNN